MTRQSAPLRGQTFFAEIAGVGRKPLVVVSNDVRNRALQTWVGARITTATKRPLATIVPLASDDPLRGTVLCDDLMIMTRAGIHHAVGALTPETMRRVDAGLKVALALS